MEQTINTFTKGLQTDIHPMALGNDVLSDALNATFVTMNGNEIILQNDMGNRRVHSAYLPPGYEPVGIKEYGGIIYIAAYNPITGKSLLGSFPSPLRKFVNGTSIGSSDNNRPTGENGIYSLLYKLSGDLDLHVGDKFVITGSLDTDAEPDDANKYSHINNIDTTKTPYKIISPKNKLYTASIGILNSQNEFVDITKSLIRYGVGDISNLNELQKFNAGTFLLSSKPSEITTTSTLSDKQLLIWRNGSNFSNYNTYSYKLVGPMYVKYDINHFLTFNYNIYGLKTSDKEATIWIEGIFIYNCPDGISKGDTDNGDETYENYEIGNIVGDTKWFGLGSINSNEIEKSGTIINTDDFTSYNKDTNLYTAKVVKKFENVTGSPYKLNVFVNNAVDTIDANLSSDIYIDLDKLNSKEIKLTAWRFINGNNTTTLTYAFEAWAAYGETLPTARFVFTEVSATGNNATIYTIEDQPIVNGRNTIVLDWSSCNLKPLKLYKVDIYYNEPQTLLNAESQTGGEGQTGGQPEQNSGTPNHAPANTENDGSDGLVEEGTSDTPGDTQGGTQGGTPQTPPKYTRWLLTTSLMNDCYSVTSDNFIVDYGNPVKEKGKTSKEEQILNDKLTINPNLNIKVIDNSKSYYDENINKLEYFIKHSDATPVSTLDFEFEHHYTLNLSLVYDITQDIKYPIDLNIQVDSITGDSQALDFSAENNEIKNQIVKFGNISFDDNYKWIYTAADLIEGQSSISNTRGHIFGNIYFKDSFKSKAKSDGTFINNPFGKAIDWFPKSCCILDENGNAKNFPIYGMFDVGKSDTHTSIQLRWANEFPIPHNNDLDKQKYEENLLTIKTEKREHPLIYPTNNDESRNLDTIVTAFNDKFASSSYVLLFMFVPKQTGWDVQELYFTNKVYGDGYNEYDKEDAEIRPSEQYSRIWIRTKDGNWALFDKLISISNYSYSDKDEMINDVFNWIINNYIGRNTIYCFADSITCLDAHIYIPDLSNYTYNSNYSINKNLDIILNITFELDDEIREKIKVLCTNKGENSTLITFKEPNTPIPYHIFHTVNFESSKKFLELVEKSTSNVSLEKIYIETGSNKDSSKQILLTDKLYTDDNGTLKLNSSLNFHVTNAYGNSKYRTIVVNSEQKGTPEIRFDLDHDKDESKKFAALNYTNNFNIVNHIS